MYNFVHSVIKDNMRGKGVKIEEALWRRLTIKRRPWLSGLFEFTIPHG